MNKRTEYFIGIWVLAVSCILCWLVLQPESVKYSDFCDPEFRAAIHRIANEGK